MEQEINPNLAKVEEKVVEDRTVKEKANTDKVLKIWSAGIGIFFLIALVVIKIQNPDFSFLLMSIIGGVIIVVCLFVFFSYNIFSMFGKKEEEKKTEKGLPQPASIATLRGIAESALVNRHFANHATGCLREYYQHVGKNHDRIYVYKTRALYNKNMKEGFIFIIINAHYPTDLKTILIDPSPAELTKAINHLASAPEEEPNVEDTQIYNPLTQTLINTRKVEKPKEEVKKEEPKKGDLE